MWDGGNYIRTISEHRGHQKMKNLHLGFTWTMWTSTALILIGNVSCRLVSPMFCCIKLGIFTLYSDSINFM